MANDVDRFHELERLLSGPHGWRELISSVPDQIMALDEHLVIHFHSLATTEASRARILGSSALDWINADGHEEITAAVSRVFAGEAQVSFEVFGQSEDGDGAWYLSSVGPVRDESGEVRFVVVITRDISDRKRSEQALERALQAERAALARQRELDELKSEFVAKVVHDLRTPITVIQGFADTLEQRWDSFDEDDRLKFIAYMGSSTRRLMLLVQDIMLVARLESGELPMQQAAFDVRAMAEDVVDELAASRGDDPVRISGPDHVPAFGDEQRIRQVLVNLLDNALRYSPPGQQVDVVIEHTPAVLRVSVIDAGPGIPKAELGRLFQRFSQVPGDSMHDGSGLGLYICRSIIEAHGGEISINAQREHGTEFTFTLPTTP